MIISSELEILALSETKKLNYEKMEKQIDSLTTLIETLLFISKIENISDLEKDSFSISKIIEKQIKEASEQYQAKNIKINKIIDSKIKINSNQKLFTVLLRNLLDNACKYSQNL
jgi:signal transduction histidine kinase